MASPTCRLGLVMEDEPFELSFTLHICFAPVKTCGDGDWIQQKDQCNFRAIPKLSAPNMHRQKYVHVHGLQICSGCSYMYISVHSLEFMSNLFPVWECV